MSSNECESQSKDNRKCGELSSHELQRLLNNKYPIHWLVWNNNVTDLQSFLSTSNQLTIESRDPRGRTPLMLSVTLGHYDCAKLLMKYNANVNVEDTFGFNVLHEAVSSGNLDFIREVLEIRDVQRYKSRVDGIPVLLKKICDTPDFYVEMKWEFTSWVPLITRMCPSDTYKIYKSGSSVRIDTTLVGFDQSSNWQRGNRSYIFTGAENGAIFMEVDHDQRQVIVETMKVLPPELADTLSILKPSDELVNARLTTPTSTTFIDTDKIHFERSKSGIIGFRTDKSETINGYDCKVFCAHNVEVVTKTRSEHLSEDDKERHKAATANRLAPLQSLLGMVEIEEKYPSVQNDDSSETPQVVNERNIYNISALQYFDVNFDLKNKDIGRPKEMTTKTQRFKANLWLCEYYPLSLPEQVLPIVDLMAISSSHFAKLRDFITLQIPAGFPVKIEIPLFHVLNARITFGNIFALEESVNGVTPIKDEESIACVVDEMCFEPPIGYKRIGVHPLTRIRSDSYSIGRLHNRRLAERTEEMRHVNMDDDDIVQYAIEQYLMEEGTETDEVTLWEALKAQQPDMDQDLQRAIQESLAEYQKESNEMKSDSHESQSQSQSQLKSESNVRESVVGNGNAIANGVLPVACHQNSIHCDQQLSGDLEIAIKLSQQESENEERRIKEEEELLQHILKISLTEK